MLSQPALEVARFVEDFHAAVARVRNNNVTLGVCGNVVGTFELLVAISPPTKRVQELATGTQAVNAVRLR